MTEVRYPYVAVDVASGDEAEAGAMLFELGADAVEERDATTLVRGVRADAGIVTLIAGFSDKASASLAIATLPPAWGPRLEEVVGDAWRDEWKKHFEPFHICPTVIVRPPWRAHAAAQGERVIELEPGRAFGTGLHETTQLVAQLLAELAPAFRGARMLDVGCGSGVLALVALALGAESARGVDIDPDAVAVTRENGTRNGVQSRLYADDTAVHALEEQFAVVVANIEAKTLVELAPALIARLRPGATLILSGILAPDAAPHQADAVRRAYGALDDGDTRRMGEWVAMSFRASLPARVGAG